MELLLNFHQQIKKSTDFFENSEPFSYAEAQNYFSFRLFKSKEKQQLYASLTDQDGTVSFVKLNASSLAKAKTFIQTTKYEVVNGKRVAKLYGRLE